MIIYHGSDHIVYEPMFGAGGPDNDYGSGFYTTLDKEKADEWALAKGGIHAVTSIYELHTDGLNFLNLDDFGPLAWVAELISNRGTREEISKIIGERIAEIYKIDTSDADIIIGYRADASYTDIIDAFLKNKVSIDEVSRLFKKGNWGEQIFIKSEKAFKALNFKGYERIKRQSFLNENEVKARREVTKFLNNREVAIQVNNFQPNGILAKNAINNLYTYNSEYGYYELLRKLEIEGR